MSKRVFIVRPFGTREGVDFDAVEATLIQPAIRAVRRRRSSAAPPPPIVEQGNIREDMFRELVTADLVIADCRSTTPTSSTSSASVTACAPTHVPAARRRRRRSRSTCRPTVISPTTRRIRRRRCRRLIAALKPTLGSPRIDSPVYQLLPNLRPPDPAVLHVVPRNSANRSTRPRSPGCAATCGCSPMRRATAAGVAKGCAPSAGRSST